MYMVYGKPNCTYCDQAKRLLTAKGLKFEYTSVEDGQNDSVSMENFLIFIDEHFGVVPKSFPQIMFEGELIGGFTELRNKLLG